MASIRAYRTSRGDRRYQVRFRDQHGHERSRAFSTHKDAQAFRLDVERRRQAGLLYQAPPERFGEAAKAWLERYARGAAGRIRPRPRSIALAHENLAKLEPLFDLAVERVRRSLVEDLIADVAATAPRRAEMSLALLKRILRSAEQRGQQVDPGVYAVRIARHEEREPRFLTWEQTDDLRSFMPEYVSRVVPIAVLTMLRRGELLAIRDQDVDLEAGAVRVLAQHQLGGRARPKTRASRRTVDVGPSVVRLLREQQLARPTDTSDGLLFPTRGGLAWDANNFMRRVFKPAAAAIDVPDLTFHDLRHTGASLMIAAGCNVKVIAEQMGHADGGALVLHRYGHLYSGAKRHAALALERHLFADTTPERAVGTVWDGVQQAWDLG